MEGKLIKENNGYTLFVDGKVFGDTDGHQLKSITNRLSIKNCQIIELDCDLDELISETDTSHLARWTSDSHELIFDEGFKIGFQKALEVIGDKKFSVEDMRMAFFHVQNEPTFDEFIQSLQQTEWDVEVEMVKEHIGSGCYKKYPKLDKEGCLILKKYKNG